MKKHFVRFALLLILTAVAPVSPAPSIAASKPSEPQPALESVVRAPEVKLRKLHLVRPDLIPYPIFFEVYC